MSLPNQDMDFTSLTPLPASDLNKMVENIEALSDGTGLENGAVTNAKLADGVVTNAKLAADALEVVLFSSTASRTVTLSSAYTNFKRLIVLLYWVDAYFTVVFDCITPIQGVTLTRQGLLDGVYKVQFGSGVLTASGTSLSGTTAGATYTIQAQAATPVAWFSDQIGEVKIARVVGIK